MNNNTPANPRFYEILLKWVGYYYDMSYMDYGPNQYTLPLKLTQEGAYKLADDYSVEQVRIQLIGGTKLSLYPSNY